MSVAAMVVGLQCEYSVNPLGIDTPAPRLFWRMRDARRGARQSAYQIVAGTKSGKADLWDSGKVKSAQCIQIPYGGAALVSGQRVYWRVRIWDHAGVESAWSPASWFEMGLLNPVDWQAQWMELPEKMHDLPSPAAMLRRTFELDDKVADARLYITARGVYIPYINGIRVGDDRLTPGWTDYNIRIRYQTYDVTGCLQKGLNALGAMLGDGWYCGHMAWRNETRLYGDRPQLLAQLHVTLKNGKSIVICSDDDWRVSSDGVVRLQSFLHGDTLDARKTDNYWNADFDDSSWVKVKTSARDKTILIAQVGDTVQRHEELPVKDSWKLENGDWVFDFGQNLVGVVRLSIKGKAGQTVILHHGEMLCDGEDRRVYLENLRSAKATDTFILSGKQDLLEPPFTLHGFRYVQVSGLTAKPGSDLVTALVYHSATAPTGTFSCSSAKLNQLQHNIVWGQKGNFVEVPTDCPQRDERMGWMGDANVFIRTATFNMDVAGFFNRWMLDVADAQLSDGAYTDVVPDLISKKKTNVWGSGAPAWGDAGVICPWTIYQAYGDTRILEQQYASMLKYIEYLDRHCDNGVFPDFGYGDWLAIGSHTDKQLIGTAYSAYSIALMRLIAHRLGKIEDEQRFAMLFDKFKAAFNREYVTPAGRLSSPSQTAAILALRFNMVDEPQRTRIANWLCQDITTRGVLTTGFVGCNLILPTLSQIGRDDLAWMLLSSEKFPSWLFSVNQGATTIWERWDGWTPEQGFQSAGMNSFNHYAYGSCGEWMYSRLGGIEIDPQFPGYTRVVVAPVFPKELSHARAKLQTLHGEVSVQWKRSGDKMTLQLVIPPNSSAAVRLPGNFASDDDKAFVQKRSDVETTLELPSGSFTLNGTPSV